MSVNHSNVKQKQRRRGDAGAFAVLEVVVLW